MTTMEDNLDHQKKSSPATIGILCFETARAMSRLVSLYNSLTDEEIVKLKDEVIKSQGVSYLNSRDEGFLLGLAFAERLEDLNKIAVTVSRLGQKCSNLGTSHFDHVVLDLRKEEFGSRFVGRIVGKMERFISATSNLYIAMEPLAELESQERKMDEWKKSRSDEQWQKINFELFNHKIALQRKQVKYYKQFSLWNQTFDKIVGVMSRVICILYARICAVFGSKVWKTNRCNQKHRNHTRVHPETNYCLLQDRVVKASNKSGLSRFRRRNVNPILAEDADKDVKKQSENRGKRNRVFQLASASTVGGSALTIRYANVILFVDRCLNDVNMVGEDERSMLYKMLPENLKAMVKTKLKRHWLEMEEPSVALAEGWREALEGIMEWLVPMAYDSIMWQAERSVERQKLNLGATTLLMQTLHYSDLEKTEAAIVEVLVGLSCICKCENTMMMMSSGRNKCR